MAKSHNPTKTILFMLFFVLFVSFATVKAVEKIRLNYKETLLLQIHSMYSQNLLKTKENLGSLQCFVTENDEIVNKECTNFYNEFIQDIPVKNYCKSLSDYSCIPNYKVSSQTPKNCEDVYEKLVNKSNDSIVLKNNKLMIIASKNKARYPYFAIDINGGNSPNIIGEDLIIFTMKKNIEGEYSIEVNSSICNQNLN